MLYGVRFLGDLSDEVTPVPIPNTVVKLVSWVQNVVRQFGLYPPQAQEA